MEHILKPTPLKNKFITPGVMVLIVLALNGFVFLAIRLLYGIGAITNLDTQHPWGIWIAIDVACGVALAAGGFTSAALGHVIHRDKYEALIRPALLTAMLGYTFVAFGVMIDLGRWYYIWHPLIYWNGNSPLFEVGICVMFYLTVLYIEFLPLVSERFIGKVFLPGILAKLNKSIDTLLRALNRGLSKTMFIFVISGVVLSTLHQSSLGTLMVVAESKVHPLWHTPILPLLYLLSAIAVGFPMVIFESILASRSFKLKPETHLLSSLARIIGPLLFIYFAFKLGDMVIRGTYIYLAEINTVSIMFVIELVVGVIIPLRMFFSDRVIKTQWGLFTASSLVIFGVVVNRINTFLVSYDPPYATTSYF
ncbi:MAG: Ni/Fe-hydrogenase cytochrome b subunit, partial [Melioribacteraceae bacterium]|nr:Ni/Fe-hydrogenase cytochrome b subunit [Melioribacteraceae bacterium]